MHRQTFRRGLALLALLVGFPSCSHAPSAPSLAPPGVVRIVLAGDVMLGRGVGDVVANDPWSIDVAQEAMVRVCERWDHVTTMASPVGYLYRRRSTSTGAGFALPGSYISG